MEFVMNSVVKKLGALLLEDHILVRDSRRDVTRIEEELACFLGDDSTFFPCRSSHGHGHGDEEEQRRRSNWARQMRDVASDAGDFADRIRLHLIRRPEPAAGVGDREALYMISTSCLRHSLAAEIRRIRSRLEDLVGEGRRNKYYYYLVLGPVVEKENHPVPGDDDGENSTGEISPHAGVGVDDQEPLGIDRAMEAVVNSWFTSVEQDTELRVLAIVGCGGLGKTTLAAALLRDLRGRFGSQAMVLASREFNLGGFLRSLLKQIMPPFDFDELQLCGSDGWKDEELCQKVEEQFLENRYIVVIDDVWTESSWKSICKIFPDNDNGSRIVVTTRTDSVAQAIRLQQGYVYSLDPLNADDSHRLLQRTLGDLTGCPTSTILEKCGGLPLSIVAVTGLVVNRLASGSSLVTACGSVSSEVEKEVDQEENLKNILNLSYNDLPAELKTGFLFLSIFPVGSSISRKRLIRRWTAEGFITCEHGKTLQHVAEELFSGLIRRNLIQPVDISSSGKVKNFHVHDVILENILSKSREEKFISIVNSHSSGLELRQNKVRWLSIHRSCNPLYPKEIMKNMNSLHIRSLTAFGTMKHLKYFEILQVLDLEGCIDLGTDQLSIICKMYLLRYLSLRRTYIRALPRRICRLQCLETLDIRETNVWRLPGNVGQLKQMVHLLGGDKSRGLGLNFTGWMTQMWKLQTLSGIMVRRRSTAALVSMRNLINLNKLSIYMETDQGYLSNCSSLTSLSIDVGFTGNLNAFGNLPASFKKLHILKLSGNLCQVPRWINRMPCLEELTLSLTSLRTDSLVLLSTLPRLCFLSFSVRERKQKQYPGLLTILQENIAESGGEIFIPACGFHGLRSLCFSGSAIPLLSFLQGSMPVLQMLQLRFRMLDGIYGLQNLTNLQKLHLQISKQASELTKEKVRQILSSVNKHQRRPMVIRTEYHEC